ncbi:MarR family transcriptional regulator [Roseovarius atlanticus]|uniref:MarR family transcriptional regulator n=1 Tax=Roseovarius atlanticus TaxID=1641875 RepID=UPI001C94A6FE|nr:MarR family transcriptional regulator [Roseovarius atlanticus]MBY5988449.1 MarR family transcriptional regulator [Roseovarius atlanticus]MBY6123840.1 MarR family transcriptional regulator [Roseovarius atlanticus]MBY6148335.1 MarR family transcriptional regulator [Roseovarius atlanticus]
MIWTVFTGDIVDSSALSADRLDDVMACLDRLSDDISAWGQGTTVAFGRRGGDGWQLAVNAAEYTLRSTLYLQSSLMALDPAVQTRIAVATGEGTLSDGPDANPNSAHGPAFSASGRLLETLSGNTLLAHAAGGPLDATFRLADHIAQGWTQAQARAVAAMLPPGTGPRRVAADRLGISRQAIDQALHAAGYPALHDALTLLETSE